MSSRKPTGQICPVSLTQAKYPSITWEKINFPKAKDQIEAKIVNYFVAAGTAVGFGVLEVTQNIENDIDYSLTLPGGRIDLELTEIIYSAEPGNPYISGSMPIKCGDFSRQIIDLVMKKSSKYSPLNANPIHLILYITHWSFLPNELVIRLIQHELNITKHIFENIFLLIPLDSKNANLRVLYPSINPLEKYSPQEFYDSTYINLDPRNVSCIENKSAD